MHVVFGLDSIFKQAKDDDINYLIIMSHGDEGGIIDFSFVELKHILDQYKGHFVITICACDSGGAIDEMQKNLFKTFKDSGTEKGAFKGSKYNVFCSFHKDQLSYYDNNTSPFLNAYFSSSKIGENGEMNADINKDGFVNMDELNKYLLSNGGIHDAVPVSQVTEPNLNLFAKNRKVEDSIIDLYSNEYGTHLSRLVYRNSILTVSESTTEFFGLCQFLH